MKKLMVGLTLAMAALVYADVVQSPCEIEETLVKATPILTLESSSDLAVKIIFENTSSKPVHYLLDNDDKSVAGLEISLSKNGESIRPTYPTSMPPEPPTLTPDRVRELKLGQGILHSWKLKEIYGPLATGRYELKIRYKYCSARLEKDFGMTPFAFQQKMYLEIEAKPKSAP